MLRRLATAFRGKNKGTTQWNKSPEIGDKNLFQDPMGLLRNPHYTKSSAFTDQERITYNLTGLLPPRVENLELQVLRAYTHFKTFHDPLAKFIYLSSLRERNETLFYAMATEHLEEVMPFIYTPTVGLACQKFGQLFRQSEGLYIDMFDDVETVLNNWRPGLFEKDNLTSTPNIIVVTDGSRILGLGDLGINGMGIPLGKLALYVAVGGFAPLGILPITLDVGTDNESLLADPLYMGLKMKRPQRQVYLDFFDDFMINVQARWPHCVIQFEDFQNKYCFEILDRYRHEYRCFNDDIQGTGVVAAAGVLSAMKLVEKKTGKKWNEHKFVFHGFGSASAGVAQQIVSCLMVIYGCTFEEASDLFYMVDSKGLCSLGRGDKENIAEYKLPFCRKADEDVPHGGSLEEVVKCVKPTCLIGLSGQGRVFTKDIVTDMASFHEDPIIFALSNPTSKAECLFSEAMEWTKGKVVWAAGSPMSPVDDRKSPQGNNLYAFPGIGFGGWLAQISTFSDEIMTAATLALVDATSDEMRANYELYPPLSSVRSVSNKVAVAVIETSRRLGFMEVKDLPEDSQELLEFVTQCRYSPEYASWRIDEDANQKSLNKVKRKHEYQCSKIIGRRNSYTPSLPG